MGYFRILTDSHFTKFRVLEAFGDNGKLELKYFEHQPIVDHGQITHVDIEEEAMQLTNNGYVNKTVPNEVYEY